MKQVFLDERPQVLLAEVPAPALGSGELLVRTTASVISTGTELANLVPHRAAQTSSRLLRKGWHSVRRHGWRATWHAFEARRARREQLVPLGYSAAGIVERVGESVTACVPGDRVACAGGGVAVHAEWLAVPQTAAARVPEDVSLEEAAWASIGAIAIHSVSRARVRGGERIVVIGLGLMGQLIAQVARDRGAHVLGFDRLAERVAMAKGWGITEAACIGGEEATAMVQAWTQEAGADAVVICVRSETPDVLRQAACMCRVQGRLVVVGDIPVAVDRQLAYERELDILMVRSSGLGRYEPVPVDAAGGETSLSNMTAFLEMVSERRVHLKALQAVRYPLSRAPEAYAALQQSPGPLAAVLSYEASTEDAASASRSRAPAPPQPGAHPSLGVAVIGAGDFAQRVIGPILRGTPGVRVQWVVTKTPHHARAAGRQFRAAAWGTDHRAALTDPAVGLVIIATPHDSHVRLVLDAIAARKPVFVEKPLGLTVAECVAVEDAAGLHGVAVGVGFNRRAAPLSERLANEVRQRPGPLTILYRMRAQALPPNHWLLDPARGGGRLLGEACHVFDFMRWLIGSDPIEVQASALAGGAEHNVQVSVRFRDGSSGTLLYTSGDHRREPKEEIEVVQGSRIFRMLDFRVLRLSDGGTVSTWRLRQPAKGHQELLQRCCAAVVRGEPWPVTATDGVWATRCGRLAHESLVRGLPVPVVV